jgi:MarR family transcriptional regulator, organic hydroperoxide resistance regulator
MKDRRLFYKLNRAHHLLYHNVEKELVAELGITPIQLGAIFFLAGHDGCLQKELALGLHLNNPAVTGLASRLEKAGIIRKQASTRDARAIHIFLTDRAKQLGEKALPLLSVLNKHLTEGFTPAEIDVIHRFLDNIITRLAKEMLE